MKYIICHYKASNLYKTSAVLGQQVVEGDSKDLQRALGELEHQGLKVQGWIEEEEKKERGQVRQHKATR